MRSIHLVIAYGVPTGFALIALWALASFVRNRDPGAGFWNLLAVMQVTIGLQAVIGAILFIMGGRPQSNGPSWLHYVYGAGFPILILGVAHWLAVRRYKGLPWAVFGFAALVCFGLTFRALQTGLGID